jgi:hypothetical protein
MLSAIGQSVLLGVLILVPLIYTEALPMAMLKTMLVAPPLRRPERQRPPGLRAESESFASVIFRPHLSCQPGYRRSWAGRQSSMWISCLVAIPAALP